MSRFFDKLPMARDVHERLESAELKNWGFWGIWPEIGGREGGRKNRKERRGEGRGEDAVRVRG